MVCYNDTAGWRESPRGNRLCKVRGANYGTGWVEKPRGREGKVRGANYAWETVFTLDEDQCHAALKGGGTFALLVSWPVNQFLEWEWWMNGNEKGKRKPISTTKFHWTWQWSSHAPALSVMYLSLGSAIPLQRDFSHYLTDWPNDKPTGNWQVCCVPIRRFTEINYRVRGIRHGRVREFSASRA